MAARTGINDRQKTFILTRDVEERPTGPWLQGAGSRNLFWALGAFNHQLVFVTGELGYDFGVAFFAAIFAGSFAIVPGSAPWTDP
jgi:hypothetical protein